jgi:DNA invertase Pin-like site-specific DNA recombinase
MTVFGYARVSTGGQDLALQIEALKAAGCERIFEEKKSGAKSANRPQLARMMKFVSHGDVIVVTRLDRLARSSRDLLNLIHEVTEIGAGFRSLAETWCDTTSAHGRLLLTIMGGFAEFERSLIMARTRAGIEHARANGKQFGRTPRLGAKQKLIIADRHAKGETIQALADDFGVGIATIWRALHGTGAE